MKFEKSTRKGKRFVAIFDDGTKVHFGSGAKGASTYIDGKRTEEERKNYLKRHDVREDFNNPKTAGALSAGILWGATKSFDKNHEAFMKRFNIK